MAFESPTLLPPHTPSQNPTQMVLVGGGGMGPLCQQSLETAGGLAEEDGELQWLAAQKCLVLQYSVARRKIM